MHVAVSGAESMEQVARNDWDLLIGQAERQRQVASQIDFYKNTLAEVEADYTPQRVVVARSMYAAPTTEQARGEARIPFLGFKDTG